MLHNKQKIRNETKRKHLDLCKMGRNRKFAFDEIYITFKLTGIILWTSLIYFLKEMNKFKAKIMT